MRSEGGWDEGEEMETWKFLGTPKLGSHTATQQSGLEGWTTTWTFLCWERSVTGNRIWVNFSLASGCYIWVPANIERLLELDFQLKFVMVKLAFYIFWKWKLGERIKIFPNIYYWLCFLLKTKFLKGQYCLLFIFASWHLAQSGLVNVCWSEMIVRRNVIYFSSWKIIL